MIYCVVPEALAPELYDKLVDHYRDEENVTVIVERRKADRRGRGAPSDSQLQRREVRDRRRPRVPGEFSTLADPSE
ncbi:MAG TPA: hypothetical protein VIC05_05585 [Solirubrobacteraceae bacterium]|jgi:hypothetical protein